MKTSPGTNKFRIGLALIWYEQTLPHTSGQRRSCMENQTHDPMMPLPIQTADGRALCLCGAVLTIATVDLHINEAHRGVGE
ncbi:hypothetical protein [Bradyrhizobium sp. OAE829]|uniref:hypothetical protein n=1 Tax=Bradyrhizobium sp. OAE829 TaxID=2663807 RepID=UPI00178A44EA